MSEKELSEEDIEQLNEDSTKAYQSPSSSVVPGLKPKKYVCTSCGHEEIDNLESPEHCGIKMIAKYSD